MSPTFVVLLLLAVMTEYGAALSGWAFLTNQTDCQLNCQNGGVCAFDRDAPHRHKCICFVGMFYGEQCEFAVSEEEGTAHATDMSSPDEGIGVKADVSSEEALGPADDADGPYVDSGGVGGSLDEGDTADAILPDYDSERVAAAGGEEPAYESEAAATSPGASMAPHEDGAPVADEVELLRNEAVAHGRDAYSRLDVDTPSPTHVAGDDDEQQVRGNVVAPPPPGDTTAPYAAQQIEQQRREQLMEQQALEQQRQQQIEQQRLQIEQQRRQQAEEQQRQQQLVEQQRQQMEHQRRKQIEEEQQRQQQQERQQLEEQQQRQQQAELEQQQRLMEQQHQMLADATTISPVAGDVGIGSSFLAANEEFHGTPNMKRYEEHPRTTQSHYVPSVPIDDPAAGASHRRENARRKHHHRTRASTTTTTPAPEDESAAAYDDGWMISAKGRRGIVVGGGDAPSTSPQSTSRCVHTALMAACATLWASAALQRLTLRRLFHSDRRM